MGGQVQQYYIVKRVMAPWAMFSVTGGLDRSSGGGGVGIL
jgi:hypothetical protein